MNLLLVYGFVSVGNPVSREPLPPRNPPPRFPSAADSGSGSTVTPQCDTPPDLAKIPIPSFVLRDQKLVSGFVGGC